MTKDLKTRAEGYAHSYPFAKVSDAYIAGAKEERNLLTQWYNVEVNLPQPHHTVMVKTEDGDIHIGFLAREGGWYLDYRGFRITKEIVAWREIHE